MRRRVVLISVMVVLVATTIGVTSVDKVGIYTMFTYREILVHSYDHMAMVFWALLFSILIGAFLGVIVTRPGFKRLSLPVIGLASIGQAIPSLALIAIIAILPLSIWGFNFGFNFVTVIIALVVYGLMPIIRNSYAGIYNIDSAIIESAQGMGMTWGARVSRKSTASSLTFGS